MPAYLSRIAVAHTLVAGVALAIDLPVDGATNALYVVKNTGANPVTAMSVARAPLGVAELIETAVAVVTGIPLAAGASLPVQLTSEPITTLRITLTSTSGTTVRIAGGGW